MTAANRNHKDTLFCRLFGSEDRKDDALALYNALSGSHHKDPAELEITTIEDTVYLGRKNDVSYLVGQEMMLVEHQSTHNPNMPLRGLHYLSKLYAKYAVNHGLDLYSEDLLNLPTPQYVVLYFGSRQQPEREVLRLSDSFMRGPGDLEVTATLLNCANGMNRHIMEQCKTLEEYSRFVEIERAHRKAGLTGHDVVYATVDQCIEEGILASYLVAHRTEVLDMLFTIEDEERAMRIHREAIARKAQKQGYDRGYDQGYGRGIEQGYDRGVERGYDRGIEKGIEKGIEQGIEKGHAQLAAALKSLGVDEALLKKALAETEQHKPANL